MVGGALPHDTSGSMKDVSDSEHILTFCDLSDPSKDHERPKRVSFRPGSLLCKTPMLISRA